MSHTPYLFVTTHSYVTNALSLCHELLILMLSTPDPYITTTFICHKLRNFLFICHEFLILMSATPDPYMSLPHSYVNATFVCHKLRIYLSKLIYTSRTPDPYVSNALPICYSHRHKSRTLYLYVTYKCTRQQLLIHTSLPHSYVTNSFFMCQRHMLHRGMSLFHNIVSFIRVGKELMYEAQWSVAPPYDQLLMHMS